MDFLQTPENQILVGVVVAVVAIGVGAVYLFSSKKSKGEGAPVIQSSAARYVKPYQELFPPGIELRISRTIRPFRELINHLSSMSCGNAKHTSFIVIFICTSYKVHQFMTMDVFINGTLLTPTCLNPEQFREFKLVKKAQLSHNVAKFTFELPTPTSVLGLPIGQHISCRGKDAQGDEVIKPYTPTTLDSDVGHFELVIK
ncbi:NADH cytochrome b5 reductase, partial [Trifolium pratense]